MRIVKAEEMKAIDTRVAKEFGIQTSILMENAGRGVAEVIEEHFKPDNLRAAVIAGKGNNGGDGFVTARWLSNKGSKVKVFLLGDPKELKGDARINYNILLKSGIPVVSIREKEGLKELRKGLKDCDVAVDAIFGTGFKAAPTELVLEAIRLLNEFEGMIFSIDVPSCLPTDGGGVSHEAVKADVTVTMAFLKPCHLVYPAREYCGDVRVVDIGIPKKLLEKEGKLFLNEFGEVKNFLPSRPAHGHKGTFGKVFCIAGSKGMTGAAVLTSLAALKAGAGLSYIGYPEGLSTIIESKLTEVVKKPLPGDTHLIPESMDFALEFSTQVDALALGPGISTHEETKKFVKGFLRRIQKPLVLDADGINCIADEPQILERLKGFCIITPHPGELARMIGISANEIDERRIDIASECAQKWGCIVVLKGAPTIIATPSTSYVNSTGNSGLASGGTGDVLTGMIAGFIAQGVPLLEAARLGVFLHGLAGDMAAKKLTEYSLIAGDLLPYIPEAIKFLKGEIKECG